MKNAILFLIFLMLSKGVFAQTKIRVSQIEPIQGTVIKSATENSGKVLTANGSGGATWQMPATVSDAAYDGATWDGVTTIAPSKNAVRDQIENMVQVFYCATAMTVNRGTLDAGTVANLCAVGGTDVNVSEQTGADPLRVTFTFTGVERMNYFVFFGGYAGSASHIVWVEILNPATNAWGYAGQFLTSATKQWYSFPIFQPNTYIRNDSVQVRINHQGSGVSTHDLVLDYVDVNFGGAGGGSTTSASAVSFAPTTTIASNNVQAAIEEIETELTSSGFLTTEEDGSVSNEGVLGIAELSSNGVRVTSNTDGAAGIAITGGNGITLGWTLGANGGGVTINATNGLPTQATYAGKFLTTNGTTASWAEAVPNNSVSFSKLSTYNTAINGYVMGYSGTYGLVWTLPPTGLPTQATHSGKYLTTNGTAAAWNSLAAVAASGSYTDLTNKPTIPSSSGASGLVQLSNGSGQFTSDANIAFNTAANILTTDTIKVTTEAYSASGWDGDVSVPTKDAIRDKIESMASSYDYYFVNDNTSLTAGVDKYINIFTTANNTGSTIYAIIDMHIDYGYGTYTHVSGNFSSDFNANAITRQNWTVQYTDYVTSNITILPELIDNGISSTFRIKLNSPVTSTHHYVLSIKYLHK